MVCGVGHRWSSDSEWLWLWCRLAAAAPIGPLAWELPYATGAALKKKKKKEFFFAFVVYLFWGGFDCAHSMWNFLSQGSSLCHSDRSHCSDNARSLTCWATGELPFWRVFFFLFFIGHLLGSPTVPGWESNRHPSAPKTQPIPWFHKTENCLFWVF